MQDYSGVCEACGCCVPSDLQCCYNCQNYAASMSHGVCISCSCAQVVAGTACCSKRCEWFASQRCPQCSRFRNASFTFCSHHCASQSLQANWCPSCGVRQIIPGTNKCAFTSCLFATAPPVLRRSTNARASFGFSQQRDSISKHNWLPADDKLRNSVASAFSKIGSVLGIVKFVPDVVGRKRYLSYRAHVEQVMAAARAVKYGHGGEGNEQRRYFPMSLTCRAMTTTLLMDKSAVDSGSPAVACWDPTCKLCSLLRYGMSMERLEIPFHFSTNNPESCLKYCAPMMVSDPCSGHDGGESAALSQERCIAAVLVARTVVGVPHVVREFRDSVHSLQSSDAALTDSSETSPETDHLSLCGRLSSMISDDAPTQDGSVFPLVLTHCGIELKSDGSDEMTVALDEAVDPMFLVFVEYY